MTDFSILGDIKADGIYFGMSDEEYHGLHRLSSSGIRKLQSCVEDFWASSWMNPLYEDEKSDAMILGTAYHKRVLEGRDIFYRHYNTTLAKEDFEGLLITAEDLKKVLKLHGQTTIGNKPELIRRVIEVDPIARIWDKMVEHHAEKNKNKILLKKDAFIRIEYSAAFVEKHPEMGKAFTGGYPEVAILWTDEETGVPMKAKLDYLKAQVIVDYKTFSNPLDKPLDRAIITAIAGRKYHVQTFVYKDAIRNAVELAKAGAIFGDHDPKFIKKALTHTEHKFLFVFQKTGISPAVRWKLFPQSSAFDCGRIAAQTQMRQFADMIEQFGTDAWIDMSPLEEFDDDDFPQYMFD